MKILIAQHLGMCFGVRDAIAEAETLTAAGPLTILGELVHNPVVRDRLRERGATESTLDAAAPDLSKQVMITAHGVSDRRREAWRSAGLTVADGTCPLVRHAHTQLRQLVRDGFLPVVIGRRGHVEVRGLTEDFAGAVVIEEEGDFTELPDAPRYGVISQTTQPIDRVRHLVEMLQRLRPTAEVRFVDTVCKPTKDRQHALQQLLTEADTIVVVGGRVSNNTRQLVETCRAAGRRTVHVERAEELKASDFANVAAVGVTAGTSTLGETVSAVVARLGEFPSSKTPNENNHELAHLASLFRSKPPQLD